MKYKSDPFEFVSGIIESWRPEDCITERDYERSLLKKLQTELPDQTVQTQYGSARQRIDIVIDGKVPIELKKDLKTTVALQRTIGQLHQYLKVWERVILVLCGGVDPDQFNSLKKYANEYKEDGLSFLMVPVYEDVERIIIIKKSLVF